MRRLIYVACLLAFATLLFVRCQQVLREYASLDPATTYTGNSSCQSCHKKIYADYLETGMGHSLYLPTEQAVIEHFGAEARVYDSHLDFYYQPFWNADEMYVREYRLSGSDTLYQRVEKVDFVIGSGHQTRSYLMQREGYLYEFPITWYVEKQLWDLSPGYEGGNNSRFDREIGENCMACHTGSFDFISGSKNRYRKISLGIDCERCHGPGSEHIRLIEGGQLIDVGMETDFSIVNPAKLPVSAQFDVCQQCHLQGINILNRGIDSVRAFRPAMALREVYQVYLPLAQDTNAFGIASHAERLRQSRCFIASGEKLTCTTCHDPHRSISASDPQQYNRSCQSCHQQEPCGLDAHALQLAEHDCVSCHMAEGGTSDIPHVSFHDHKIRILDTLAPSAPASVAIDQDLALLSATDSTSPALEAQAWLTLFENQAARVDFLEKIEALQPNNAWVQAKLAYYQGRLTQAEQQLLELIQVEGQTLESLFFMGEIKEAQQQYLLAYQNYEAAYQLNKESIEAGLKAATTQLRTIDGPEPKILVQVATRLETLKREKPFDKRILSNLGFVYMNQGRLMEARFLFEEALRYDPDYRLAQQNLALLP